MSVTTGAAIEALNYQAKATTFRITFGILLIAPRYRMDQGKMTAYMDQLILFYNFANNFIIDFIFGIYFNYEF